MAVTGLPTLQNARRTEIDVLGMVLVVELRSEQPDHMHLRRTAVARQLSYCHVVALGLRQTRSQLIDNVTQTMRLLLSLDMARNPTGILHVLVPVQHLRHRRRLGAQRIPEMYRKDQ